MRVLVTAGAVYGRLDDNKLVGNRIRGLWASRFAIWLNTQGHEVTLLIPDLMDRLELEDDWRREFRLMPSGPRDPKPFVIVQHTGYESYAKACYEFAPMMDAAVMAAAVVNWIPKTPFVGKMPTEGFEEGAEQNIPFILAPRVIDRMRKLNPNLTLIGCKMTSGASREDLYVAAYKTLLKSHANVIVANDLGNLKNKFLLYPDGTSMVPGAEDGGFSFEQMYFDLLDVMHDQHYRTDFTGPVEWTAHEQIAFGTGLVKARARFDALCDEYRERFVKRPEGPHGPDRVFGAVAVRIDKDYFLVSPREKGAMFSSLTSVVVRRVDRVGRTVHVLGSGTTKATMNAPLLASYLETFPGRDAVVHLHEQLPNVPTLDYAPPGTTRDSHRRLEHEAFNIKGHGCVFGV